MRSLFNTVEARLCLLAIGSVCFSPVVNGRLEALQSSKDRVDVMDLAILQPGKTDTVHVAVGTNVTVTTANQIVPGKGYSYYITVSQGHIELPNLGQPVATDRKPPAAGTHADTIRMAMADSCSADDSNRLAQIRALSDSVKAQKDEAGVSRALYALTASARPECSKYKETADSLVDATTKLTTSKLSAGTIVAETQLVIEITRTGADNVIKSWRRIYLPPETGMWRTGFGGVYVWGYHTKQRYYVDSGNTVRESNRRLGAQLVPVVSYNWDPFLPPSKFPVRISAGLGIDISHPVLTLGMGMTFYQNIVVSAGFAAFEGDALKRKYNPGDKVAAGIQSDDLFEKQYFAKPFVGLTFRFQSNPFSSTPQTASPKQPTNPASGSTPSR
jgi:hypothetical protein